MSFPAIELVRYRSANFLPLNEREPDRWLDIDHFRPSEFYGRISGLSAALLLALDEYRKHLGFPIYISPANWGRHSQRSFHYALVGRNPHAWAVDVFPACALAYAREVALKMPFWGGVGTYPYWRYPAHNLQGGLHLDIRRQTKQRTTWWVDDTGQTYYFRSPDETLSLSQALAA